MDDARGDWIDRTKKRRTEATQVYLDPQDRALLEQLAGQTGLSRAELLRRGIRRISTDLADRDPGWSLKFIAGLTDDADGPTDLSVNHDKYIGEALDDEAKRWSQS